MSYWSALTSIPVSDINFKSALSHASNEELWSAIDAMEQRDGKDKGRIAACKSELRRRAAPLQPPTSLTMGLGSIDLVARVEPGETSRQITLSLADKEDGIIFQDLVLLRLATKEEAGSGGKAIRCLIWTAPLDEGYTKAQTIPIYVNPNYSGLPPYEVPPTTGTEGTV